MSYIISNIFVSLWFIGVILSRSLYCQGCKDFSIWVILSAEKLKKGSHLRINVWVNIIVRHMHKKNLEPKKNHEPKPKRS